MNLLVLSPKLNMVNLFLFVLCFSLQTNAASSNCVPCQAVQNLEVELFALDPLNPDDSGKGSDGLNEVVRLLVDFQGKARTMPEANEYFNSLVRLSAATVPYGGYAQGVEELIVLMKANTGLKRRLSTAIETVPLYCHKELLKNTIATMDCTFAQSAAGIYETPEGNGKGSCRPKPFRFHDCLKEAKRNPQTKSTGANKSK